MPRKLTTSEVAAKLRVNRVTLQEWIRRRRVYAPKLVVHNGRTMRLWSMRDITRLRGVTSRHYERKRGSKAKQSARKPTPPEIDTSKRGGRPPAIHSLTLQNHRDRFLSLLSQAWGDVGPLIPRVTTLEELRTALQGLSGVTSPWHRLVPFLRPRTERASRSDLKATRVALGQVTTRRAAVQTLLQSARDRVAQTQQVLDRELSADDVQAIRAEHAKRLQRCVEYEQEWTDLQARHITLENKVADQEADYVQQQLLSFIQSPRKHARSPENLAGAMAGLPETTASYSFQVCRKTPNPNWPFPTERIFRLIARTFAESHDETSKERLVNRLRSAIRQLDDSWLRLQLATECRYLRQAIEALDTEAIGTAYAPHQVFAAYQRLLAAPRTAEEVLRAEMERIDLEEDQRHGLARRRRSRPDAIDEPN